jgi:hypothetical protein
VSQLEFVPFYGAVLLVSGFGLPDWLISVGTVFRFRRLWDLFSYWHQLEVSGDPFRMPWLCLHCGSHLRQAGDGEI